MNLGCRYRSSIAYAILITFLLNGLFFFFSENKDMGRFLYETIKKVNARKTSRIVNLNQIGKNKSAVCMGKSSSCRSFNCQTIEVCSNRLKMFEQGAEI